MYLKKAQFSLFLIISVIIILFSVLIIGNVYNNDSANFNNYTSSKKYAKSELETCMYLTATANFKKLFDNGGVYITGNENTYIANLNIINKSRIVPIYISYDEDYVNITKEFLQDQISISLKDDIGQCFESFLNSNNFLREEFKQNMLIDVKILKNKIIYDIKAQNVFTSEQKNISLNRFNFEIENDLNDIILLIDNLKQLNNGSIIHISEMNNLAKAKNIKIYYENTFSIDDKSYIIYKASAYNIDMYFAQKIMINNQTSDLRIIGDYYFNIYKDDEFKEAIITNCPLCRLNYTIIDNDFKNAKIDENGLFSLFLSDEISYNDFYLFDIMVTDIDDSQRFDRHLVTVRVIENEN